MLCGWYLQLLRAVRIYTVLTKHRVQVVYWYKHSSCMSWQLYCIFVGYIYIYINMHAFIVPLIIFRTIWLQLTNFVDKSQVLTRYEGVSKYMYTAAADYYIVLLIFEIGALETLKLFSWFQSTKLTSVSLIIITLVIKNLVFW